MKRLPAPFFIRYPDGDERVREMDLVYDEKQRAIGVVLALEGHPLDGTQILIGEGWISEVKAKGVEAPVR